MLKRVIIIVFIYYNYKVRYIQKELKVEEKNKKIYFILFILVENLVEGRRENELFIT